MANPTICKIHICGNPANRGEYCSKHRRRLERHGNPLGGTAPNGAAKFFVEHVAIPFMGDNCLIWPYGKTTAGYGVFLEGRRHVFVHRRVCEAVHGPSEDGFPYVAHGCGNPSCCNPAHLRWATPTENSMDKLLHGTMRMGERSPGAKLTDSDVRAIRSAPSDIRQADLAKIYGVTSSRISTIRTGKGWRHLA